MSNLANFEIISATQLRDNLHGWLWTWDANARCIAFGLDVVGCWISVESYGPNLAHTARRLMPPWPGSRGFVPTLDQLKQIIAEK